MKMQFSVGMGRNERIDEIADHARVAEESGFSHVTFVDQQNLSRDVYVMMAIAALTSHRIRIGHGVTQPFTFHPSVIANATATIDELSGGRAFLGIGAGGNALRSMGTGMEARPVQEFREAVNFIRRYMGGEEAEFKGAKMHSEWVRRPVPIYMAAAGPKALQLAGELADGVIFPAAHPETFKWGMEQIEKGATRAKRDPSKIDVWVRTLIYVAESKELALREAASYAATMARNRYVYLQSKAPEFADLRLRIERAQPGIMDEFKRIHDAWDEYQHEATDAPHAKLVTQRIVDFFHLTGTPEGICERIYTLGQLGAKTISTVTFTIIDKKGMMREIGDKIMPHFRN